MASARLGDVCAVALARTVRVLARAGTGLNYGEGIEVRYGASVPPLGPDTKCVLATPTPVGWLSDRQPPPPPPLVRELDPDGGEAPLVEEVVVVAGLGGGINACIHYSHCHVCLSGLHCRTIIGTVAAVVRLAGGGIAAASVLWGVSPRYWVEGYG